MTKINRFLIDSKQPQDFVHQIKNAFPMTTVSNLGDFSGDLLIQLSDKTILIEVKSSPNDFVASIMDKRLFKQAEGMKAITPWSFLLHPDFKYASDSRVISMWETGYGPSDSWNRNHIEGALTAVQARGVICRPNYLGYVESIRRIIDWVSTADIGSVTQEGIKLSPFDKDDQLTVNLLCWFEGIGITQAKNFLQWVKGKYGDEPRWRIFELATTELDKFDRPVGWTSHTIAKNRKQMQYPEPIKQKTEWVEELDI